MIWTVIDVGGTVTDAVLYDIATARLALLKTPCMPRHPSEGILAELAQIGVFSTRSLA